MYTSNSYHDNRVDSGDKKGPSENVTPNHCHYNITDVSRTIYNYYST